MVVRYDSLNRLEIPKLYLCNPGSTYDSGAVSGMIGVINDTRDEEMILNFNALSELNFRVDRVKRVDAEDDGAVLSIYKGIQNRRMIFVDDVGYFIITKSTENFENGQRYKDIHAESCEKELQNKKVPYIEDGTYAFTDLLERVIATIPYWTIDTIDANVAGKYRTFEDVSENLNCLGFMLENMQDAYECIFMFDCINRTVSVYDQNNYVKQTSIHITHDDVINSLEIEEISDDLYTAISVLGDNNLNIAAVNPLGTNVIYNFDYYIDWMGAELAEKVSAWEAAVHDAESTYREYNEEYYGWLEDSSDYSADIDQLDTVISMYRRCRENIVAAYQDNPEGMRNLLDSYNNVIRSNGGESIYSIGKIIPPSIDPDDENADAKEAAAAAPYHFRFFARRAGESEQELYKIIGAPSDGDAVVIYHEESKTVLTSYEAGTGLSGISARLSDDGDILYLDGPMALFTVSVSNGTYVFSADSKYLSINSVQSGLVLSADHTENSEWTTAQDTYGLCQITSKSIRGGGGILYSIGYLGGELVVVGDSDELMVAATLVSIDDKIAEAESKRQRTSLDLANIESELELLGNDIDQIRSSLSPANYFSAEELAELNNYIYEGSYSDEYTAVTDTMTYPERFEQMSTLYNRAVAQLERISKPTQQFSVDVENFIFIKEFQDFSEQLETGSLINVEIEENDIASLFLSTISINYDDRNMSLTFGNRFYKSDPRSLFEDALGGIQKSSNSLAFVKEVIYPIKQGELDRVKEDIENSRNLTKSAVLASTGEEVLIDDTGYTGRKKNDSGEGYDPHQIKITGRNIVFTDDAWETSKLALGLIILNTGDTEANTVYGINAEAVIGELLLGNNLQIYSNVVDEEGHQEKKTLFEVVDGKIRSSVEAYDEEILGRNYSTVEQMETQVAITVGSIDGVSDDGGGLHVDGVRTEMGYTFDADGLQIHKSGEEIYNLIDNTGMYVNRGADDNEVNLLTVNSEGVDALNLTARQYLIIGSHSRFEPYEENGEKRTACFALGTIVAPV